MLQWTKELTFLFWAQTLYALCNVGLLGSLAITHHLVPVFTSKTCDQLPFYRLSDATQRARAIVSTPRKCLSFTQCSSSHYHCKANFPDKAAQYYLVLAWLLYHISKSNVAIHRNQCCYPMRINVVNFKWCYWLLIMWCALVTRPSLEISDTSSLDSDITFWKYCMTLSYVPGFFLVTLTDQRTELCAVWNNVAMAWNRKWAITGFPYYIHA